MMLCSKVVAVLASGVLFAGLAAIPSEVAHTGGTSHLDEKSSGSAGQLAKRPNIVMVMADDCPAAALVNATARERRGPRRRKSCRDCLPGVGRR